MTGGSGVIGRELIQRLVGRGDYVYSLDLRSNISSVPQDSGFRELHKDLAEDSLDDLIDMAPDVIYHLAASFERSEESPEFWVPNWRNNMLASHRLLDFARRISNLRTFVFASSYLVYAPHLYLRESPVSSSEGPYHLKEIDPKNPRNLCGAAKWYTEKELAFWEETSTRRVDLISARIFRVYGRGSRDVISRWIRDALIGKQIPVFNENNVFDYIYAGDVAEGLIRLADKCGKGQINLGSGLGRSIAELIGILRNYFPALDVNWMPTTPPYEASAADLNLLTSLTDWAPPTSLEEGIDQIFQFESANLSP